jgi:hypothetical protein
MKISELKQLIREEIQNTLQQPEEEKKNKEKIVREKIMKILTDDCLSEKLSFRGEKTAKAFSAEKIFQKYEKIFQQVIKQGNI